MRWTRVPILSVAILMGLMMLGGPAGAVPGWPAPHPPGNGDGNYSASNPAPQCMPLALCWRHGQYVGPPATTTAPAPSAPSAPASSWVEAGVGTDGQVYTVNGSGYGFNAYDTPQGGSPDNNSGVRAVTYGNDYFGYTILASISTGLVYFRNVTQPYGIWSGVAGGPGFGSGPGCMGTVDVNVFQYIAPNWEAEIVCVGGDYNTWAEDLMVYGATSGSGYPGVPIPGGIVRSWFITGATPPSPSFISAAGPVDTDATSGQISSLATSVYDLRYGTGFHDEWVANPGTNGNWQVSPLPFDAWGVESNDESNNLFYVDPDGNTNNAAQFNWNVVSNNWTNWGGTCSGGIGAAYDQPTEIDVFCVDPAYGAGQQSFVTDFPGNWAGSPISAGAWLTGLGRGITADITLQG